jgi:hypothetical protein
MSDCSEFCIMVTQLTGMLQVISHVQHLPPQNIQRQPIQSYITYKSTKLFIVPIDSTAH